ncbi:hypothetical protein RHSIM_Rhsim11G0082200 [Rhododendron simsii]|uniref:Cellulose synthase n=1 Tax=Rhododendron simsii TaxID=118357 RepID=A0A834LBC1_RHOSS|nr:hypothetical protein RHSIM_Rhsim11G0082200 [Rhododendron simsii]
MCFMMDPASGKKICYVQFPQRFDGIDRQDRYANRNTIFFDISWMDIWISYFNQIQDALPRLAVRVLQSLKAWILGISPHKPFKSLALDSSTGLGILCNFPECPLSTLLFVSSLGSSSSLRKQLTISSLGIYISADQHYSSIVFMALFISIAATSILEIQWGRVTLDDWWRNEQFWLISGVSSHFFALFQGFLKALTGVNANITIASKDGGKEESLELHLFKWTSLLILPMTLLIINVIGVIVGVADTINNGYNTWVLLFAKFFFALWVILHFYPFLKGLMGKQAGVPTIIVVWTILLASILSLLWVWIDLFLPKGGIVLEVRGLNCN